VTSAARILRGEGTIARQPFVIAGIVLGILKQSLDILLATVVFRHGGVAFNYWLPFDRLVAFTSLEPGEYKFLLAMVALALPFIWAGVCLTLARLRDAALPAWLVLFFFLPIFNVLFFIFLCCTPSQEKPPHPLLAAPGPPRPQTLLDRMIPRSGAGSAFAGAMLALVIGLLLVLLSTSVLTTYGWGLFCGVPFMMGFLSVMIYCHHELRPGLSCMGVACLSPMLLGLALLVYAFEGVMCLLMAAPLALALSVLGGGLAYSIQRWRGLPETAAAMMSLVLLVVPAGMALEHGVAPEPPTFAVTSSVEVDAPPEAVWPNVVAFAELPPPQELLFRAGVAYPIRAEITGTGPGAIRHCVFSTGAFVEPIEVWDAPRLLKFSVQSNPAPLAEWTPYERVTPPHLRGFLVSRGGQFHLTPLPGGRTLLEGTTWYRHSMWPAAYWRLWSDQIIHQIHLRVLHYIATRSILPR